MVAGRDQGRRGREGEAGRVDDRGTWLPKSETGGCSTFCTEPSARQAVRRQAVATLPWPKPIEIAPANSPMAAVDGAAAGRRSVA